MPSLQGVMCRWCWNYKKGLGTDSILARVHIHFRYNLMENLNLTSFEDFQDEFLGKVGTPKRDAFEKKVEKAIQTYYSGCKSRKHCSYETF